MWIPLGLVQKKQEICFSFSKGVREMVKFIIMIARLSATSPLSGGVLFLIACWQWLFAAFSSCWGCLVQSVCSLPKANGSRSLHCTAMARVQFLAPRLAWIVSALVAMLLFQRGCNQFYICCGSVHFIPWEENLFHSSDVPWLITGSSGRERDKHQDTEITEYHWLALTERTLSRRDGN